MIKISGQWDEKEFPLAYLITIRTYGTWLHGDKRGAVDTHGNNAFGSSKVADNQRLEFKMKANQKEKAFLLNQQQRSSVKESIKQTCEARGYILQAVNVRTNHMHAVVSAATKPEIIINGFKSHATRKLIKDNLILKGAKVWSRGGSRRYLWKDADVTEAIDYVLYGQGLLPIELKGEQYRR